MRMNDLPDSATVTALQPDRDTLRNWYSPWRHVHPSWLDGDAALSTALQRADVLQRRLAYPGWCERFSLARHPENFDGSIWWQVAFAESAVFKRADHLVSLAMLFAHQRGKSLGFGRDARSSGASADDLRWALSRASLIPGSVFELAGLRDDETVDCYGLASVGVVLADSYPALYRRITLRYRIAQVNRNARTKAVADDENTRRAVRILTRLWSAALQHAGDCAGPQSNRQANTRNANTYDMESAHEYAS